MSSENTTTNTSSLTVSNQNALLVVQVSAYCVVLVASLLGNSLVIITIKKDQNELKKLVMGVTICHMAVADLLTTIVGLPFMILRILYKNTWLITGTFGLVVCKVHSFAIEVGFAVSALSIAVIALERFLSVFFPLKKLLTIRSAHRIGFTVWMASCAFYSPRLYTIDVFKYQRKMYCIHNPRLLKHWLELEAICYVVLFIVTLFMYIAIIVKILRRDSVPGRIVSESSQLARNRTSRRVIRQGLGVITIHYLCWLPYIFINMSCILLTPKPAICGGRNVYISFLIFFLGFSNGALNPVLYAATNESFRKGCRTVFRNLRISFTARIIPLTLNRHRPDAFSIAKTSSGQDQPPLKKETLKMEPDKADLNSVSPETVNELSAEEKGIP